MQSLEARATLADALRRDILLNRLDILEKEVPWKVFRTDDLYAVTIKNESGSEVTGGLSKKSGVLFGIPFSMPGYLNTMAYEGVVLYDHCHIFAHVARFPDGSWTGIGRRAQHEVPLEELAFGVDVYGGNHLLYPFGRGDDARLADRIIGVFRKYGSFVDGQESASRYLEPLYDARARLLRRGKRASGRLLLPLGRD